MDNLAGQVIRGYELRERIGAGGFGAVYRAFQPSVSREVAIKIILPEFANHPDFIRRFEAEAQLIARLEHIHIVPLYDYWREPGGAYLVMRWLRGGSLRDLLSRGPLSLNRLAELLDQITSALAAAHRHNVVHRDLKPDNILLDEAGNAYLADFGIAKDLVAAITDENEESDTLAGSPAYISPEQIVGGEVTPQADIYGLGVMLYELLTGHHPYEDINTAAMLFKHLREPLPDLHTFRPDLPETLELVIQKATAKKPEDRYTDVIDLADNFFRAIESTEGLTRAIEPQQAVTPRTLVLTGTARTLPDIAPPHVENPYKGLRSFEEADSADFFGREVLVGQILDRLAEDTPLARFLAVIGPSGSGKSSVVKAGVIPALRRGDLMGSKHWFLVEMTPGANPFLELETALLGVAVNPIENLPERLRASENGLAQIVHEVLPPDEAESARNELFLYIDQFEELFTLVEDEDLRAHFLGSLLVAITEPDSRLRIVVTLRADFYDRPLLYPAFGNLMRLRTEVVLPLSPEELERAIIGPAERVGLSLEIGLVTAIIADVGEQPGALPLMQYALTELFERRKQDMLTLDAYLESGGVFGALARRADELYEKLYEDERKAARQLFLRLVTLGEGTEDTRRRILQAELASIAEQGQAMHNVIDLFGKYRLLTFDRDPVTRSPTVEVAHEALIRQWKLLRSWLDAGREDVRLQRRLAAAAAEWLNAKRDPSFLATGVRLEQFEEWSLHTELALNQVERDYLEASLARREAQETAEAARRAREDALEQRSRDRLRALVAVLLAATAVAFVLTLIALNQRQIAESNAQAAVMNAEEARSLALASAAQLALTNRNTELGLALALDAGHFELPLARRALYEAAYAPGIKRRLVGHTGTVLSTAFSPDGQAALSGSADGSLILWDTATGAMLKRLSGHTDWVKSVAFSPNGKTALSGSADMTLILWDIASGDILRRFTGHTGAVWSVAFSPDGQTALSAGSDENIILWDIASGGILRRFDTASVTVKGQQNPVYSIALSPDGRTAVSGASDGSLTLWDIDTGSSIRRFGANGDKHDTSIWGVAFSPDGKTALSASGDRTLILWDVETGNAIRRFEGHSDWVLSVVYSPDGQMALSGAEDNQIILWDIATGQIVRRLEGHSGKIFDVAFSPDGRTVISGSDDRTAILWDIENGDLLRRLKGHTNWVNSVAFSPDGETALSASSDNSLILWNLDTGEMIRRLQGHSAPVWTVVFSDDGRRALSGSDDTTIILWDVETGTAIRQFTGHGDWINAVAFSPDNRTFMSASGDATLMLWDVETGAPIRKFIGHDDAVTGVVFRPDGRRAYSSSYDGSIIEWDVETGREIIRIKAHDDWVNGLALSPDGQMILSGSNDGTMALWDVTTGARLRGFKEHTGPVFGVAFSPDGQTAVSASADHTLIRWEIATGAPMYRLDGHTKPVNTVAFSPDGRRVLSGANDSSLLMWRMDSLDEVIQWTQANRSIRELTCGERAQYQVQTCDENAVFPTRTPYLMAVPSATATPTATPDLAKTTATPMPTITPTLPPLPSPTATLLPKTAALGDNRGEISVGSADAWMFSGQQGDVLTISVYANNPTNAYTLDESLQRGLLDTLVTIYAPDGTLLAQADDIGEGITDSRIESLVLPATGIYIIDVQSYGNLMAGPYTLVIEKTGSR